MVIDCARACSLDIMALIKIIGENFILFTGLWFRFLCLPTEKNKNVSWKNK
jgi:hypothetical protein